MCLATFQLKCGLCLKSIGTIKLAMHCVWPISHMRFDLTLTSNLDINTNLCLKIAMMAKLLRS